MAVAYFKHLWFRVFKAIDEIYKRHSKADVDSPAAFFRREIERLPKKHGYVRDLFWKNWRDLRLAIEECRRSNNSADEVPFVICRRFIRLVCLQKNPTERMLAEQEQVRN
jgi:hypothetical protein